MLEFILEPLSKFIIFLISKLSYTGIFLAMAIESACIPLPSEIIMPFSGFMVSKGYFNFWLVTLAGALGCLFGSIIAYSFGYQGGEKTVKNFIKKFGKYILIFEEDFDRAKNWFKKYGQIITFTARLLPVIRTFISLPAGISHMNFFAFCFFCFVGSFIWSALLAYLGYFLGENWQTLGSYFHKFDLVIFILVIFGTAFYFYRKLKKNFSRNNTNKKKTKKILKKIF